MPGRSPISCVTHLGQARCHKIVQAKRGKSYAVGSKTNCWLFEGSCNSDGYGQIWTKKNCNANKTGHQAQTAFCLHIVSFVAANGRDPDGQVSHLCNSRNCFNPDHLVDESAQLNNSRKGCAGPIFCSVHGHLVLDLCAHTPRCIRDVREDVNCCLAIEESDPAWATQTHREQFDEDFRTLCSDGRAVAASILSSEYSGADILDEAMKDGLTWPSVG